MKTIATPRQVLGLLFLFLACCLPSLQAQKGQVVTDAGTVQVKTLIDSLDHPWGMAFLPDGRMLVTERPGRLRIVQPDTTLSEPVAGTPEVLNWGQGGLLDVVLDPDFANNQYIYLSFAEPAGDSLASSAFGRGRWVDDRIEDFEVLFSQEPKLKGPNHYGGRLVFADDGTLFFTLGERFQFDPAQDLSNHLGTVVRLNADGSIPDDNPFVDRDGAQAAIYSYGHRNIEAGAIDPATGKLWLAEMGPLGGDEFNAVAAGNNYGWPVVSWGDNYDGTEIPDPTTRPEFADAAIHWTPTISPSGMVFYSGDLFPEWRGSALIGGLTASGIVRVSVDGDTAQEVERIPLVVRVREVAEAPDGSIYVLTDAAAGKLLHLRLRE
ncbi:PQQ-dependent sugar dehydrogenase [Neolewinella litorea]|uniref:PQQ-dependent sugar dehydrogenase n=1 Tax=Neolewinella litorea TaxID=2562452 RepID=A0A4S4NNT0_9BACT|nr:PQQ-dependent sugar dehydrogenase [Neolewinella litorea]THH40687.1 PQQ-dependent sugar dehydrogenase [Neolewinella litorea]